MLQESLNHLRSQFLGLSRILSTLTELVNRTVQSRQEQDVLHCAADLLIEHHNIQHLTVHLCGHGALRLAATRSVNDLLNADQSNGTEPWISGCGAFALEHMACPQELLMKREVSGGYDYSLSLRFDDHQIGFMVINTSLFDEHHEKFLPMFAGVLTSVLLNKRQQSRLVEDVQRRSSALESAWDDAGRSDSAGSQFLSNLSHEYLTPLNVISNASGVLMDTELSSEQSQAVVSIIDAASNLSNMIGVNLDNVQSASTISGHRQQNVNLARLATEIVGEFDNQVESDRLSIELVCHDLPAVEADTKKLRQILTELVSNAVKFTSEGRIEVSLHLLKSSTNTAMVEFRVSDTGIGIAPEDQRLVFNAFHQLNNGDSGFYSNTGFSLAMCQRLARSLGSEIILASAPGKGSTFHFNLEFVLSSTNLQGKAVSNGISEEMSVLLVEDNLVNQKLAARLLEKIGCHVDIANDGIDAVSKFTDGRYDMVFMDCQMPNMDGFEATSRIRELESDRRTPIIALTANIMPEDRARSYRAGMDEFLTKPLAKEQLKEAVQRWSPTS